MFSFMLHWRRFTNGVEIWMSHCLLCSQTLLKKTPKQIVNYLTHSELQQKEKIERREHNKNKTQEQNTRIKPYLNVISQQLINKVNGLGRHQVLVFRGDKPLPILGLTTVKSVRVRRQHICMQGLFPPSPLFTLTECDQKDHQSGHQAQCHTLTSMHASHQCPAPWQCVQAGHSCRGLGKTGLCERPGKGEMLR